MTEKKITRHNYFISGNSFLSEQAKKRVIEENGQLITPAYKEKSTSNEYATSEKEKQDE